MWCILLVLNIEIISRFANSYPIILTPTDPVLTSTNVWMLIYRRFEAMFRKVVGVLCLLFAGGTSVKAQATLPDFTIVTQNGVNVLNWVCQYDGIKSIAVERSNDSIFNFKTIGYVKTLKKGVQAFIDGHPTPGNNYYRLNIVFASDLNWMSNRGRIFVDSAQLLKQAVLPPNDSLQKMIASSPKIDPGNPNPEEIDAYTYVRSQYVFTNPFTGHVNVELPDNQDRLTVFSLDFYDLKTNKRVLEVPRVPEQSVVIDKRNFQRKGVYKFELRQGREMLEKGYITIY